MEEEFGQSKHVLNTRMAQQPIPNTSQGLCRIWFEQGEFPITTLRPIAIKSAIKEVFWIYQDQTNSLDVLEDKYNVHYWNDWEVEGVPANNGDKRSIGQRYGAVVKKHDIINRLLAQLEANPWNRRNVISLWDYEAFEETADFSLAPSRPCLMFVVWVRRLFGCHFDAALKRYVGGPSH